MVRGSVAMSLPRCRAAALVIGSLLSPLITGSSAVAAPATVFRPLDPLHSGDTCFVSAISSDGSAVVGYCESAHQTEPVRWDVQGAQGLGFLAGSAACLTASVSGDGSVVTGVCDFPSGDSSVFRWDAVGGIQDLGSLPDAPVCFLDRSNIISFDGSVIAGDCASEDMTINQAFRWDPIGGIQGLGDLPNTTQSLISGLSSDGTVVIGVSAPSDFSTSQGFRWNAVNGMEALTPLSTSFPYCSPTAASRDGSFVTGICDSSDKTTSVAVRWDAANDVQSLGVPSGQTESFAFYISEDGAVVAGDSDAGNSQFSHALRWDAVNGIVGLGVLPGFDGCETTSLSGDGSIQVGLCVENGQNPAAFVWDAQHGVRDLRGVLADQGNDLSGWLLSSGPVVSADGRTFAGTGTHAGDDGAWVAPEPSAASEGALALACAGLCARRARARLSRSLIG